MHLKFSSQVESQAKHVSIFIKNFTKLKVICYIYLQIANEHEESFMSTRQYVVDERGLANTFAIEPKMYVQETQAGFKPAAELLNGRLAMIGFVSLLVLEVATGHSLVGFFSNLS